MVSSTVTENGQDNVKIANNFPTGDLRVVGWDVDTTGRTLLDEICQIAAYTPTDSYSQYVMPHGNFKFGAKKKHKIKVVTLGPCRMLKSAVTNKLVKTKSEISALRDFLQWLETVRGDSRGILLVTYEATELAAPLLVESLRRYNLMDQFSELVKGFANGYSVATIVEHLLAEERPENKGSGDGGVGLAEALREYAVPISKEEEIIQSMKDLLARKKSLRPVFASMMSKDKREVPRAVALRSIIADAGISYEDLVNANKSNGEAGLSSLLHSKTENLKPKDLADLMNILSAHFNPPETPTTDGKSNGKPQKSNSEDLSNCNSPDTTTSPIKEAANGSVTDTVSPVASPQSSVSPEKSPTSENTVSSNSEIKSN